MRSILTTLFLACMATVGIRAQQAPLYQPADSITVVSLLAKARLCQPSTNYMLFFARQLKDIPYVAQTLEVSPTERLIVNLRQLDCTTYVETVCALTMCMNRQQYSFADYCHNLQMLRYRNGIINGYDSRLHYFTQWIEDNTRLGFVRETQSQAPPFNATQTIDVFYMSRNPEKYPMLKGNTTLISSIAAQEHAINGTRYQFITKDNITNTQTMRRTINDGDIIAIITSIPGLDTSHIGIAVWHRDGLHLLNASQIHKKVVEEPMTLRKYMQQHPRQTGIRVIRFL